MLREIVKMGTQRLEQILTKLGFHIYLTKEIDPGLDEYIDKIYEEKIAKWYRESFEVLKQITKDFAQFPTIMEWNKYASEYHYLNHISIQYMINLNWDQIKRKVEYEINGN